MTVDDSVMQKLWKLTNELTAQLVFNRNATLELKQQLADLQVSNLFFSFVNHTTFFWVLICYPTNRASMFSLSLSLSSHL